MPEFTIIDGNVVMHRDELAAVADELKLLAAMSQSGLEDKPTPCQQFAYRILNMRGYDFDYVEEDV
jgi:hypothetical protein